MHTAEALRLKAQNRRNGEAGTRRNAESQSRSKPVYERTEVHSSPTPRFARTPKRVGLRLPLTSQLDCLSRSRRLVAGFDSSYSSQVVLAFAFAVLPGFQTVDIVLLSRANAVTAILRSRQDARPPSSGLTPRPLSSATIE